MPDSKYGHVAIPKFLDWDDELLVPLSLYPDLIDILSQCEILIDGKYESLSDRTKIKDFALPDRVRLCSPESRANAQMNSILIPEQNED